MRFHIQCAVFAFVVVFFCLFILFALPGHTFSCTEPELHYLTITLHIWVFLQNGSAQLTWMFLYAIAMLEPRGQAQTCSNMTMPLRTKLCPSFIYIYAPYIIKVVLITQTLNYWATTTCYNMLCQGWCGRTAKNPHCTLNPILIFVMN